MGSGKVLHGSHDGIHVLRFVGDIRYALTPAVTAFVNHVFADEEVAGFVVDLSETTSIDSTNLGMLARLAVRADARCGHPVTVVACAPDIRELLDSMGISSVCDVVDHGEDDDSAEIALADSGPSGEEELARVMLDAHRALMELSQSNREQFQDVVEMLERAATRKI